MVRRLKVVLVINSMIGPDINGGPGKEGYNLAVGLLKKNALGKVFCYGATKDCDLPQEKVVAFCKGRIKRGALRILDRLHKRYPVIRGRRRTEQWVDRMYAANLTEDSGQILYCPKPIYPKTIRRAKALGMTTLVETSVLHARFNLEVVSAERKRLSINGAAGYTDEVRVCNIEEAIDQADYIFAWSDFVRDSYINYGVPAKKFIGGANFAPPGIDTDRYRPANRINTNGFIVLHLSSITVIKGVQYLLDAWDKVAEDIDGRLLLVGPIDRDMKSVLRARALKKVEWLGKTDNPLQYYQNASVFVSPSLSDAGPRAVLESMACCVPAIVSDRCGVSQCIDDGQNGMVYEHDDVNKLAFFLKWSYENQSKLEVMGEKARATVESFSVEGYSSDVWERISLIAKDMKCT